MRFWKKKEENKIRYISNDDKMVGLGKFVEGESIPVFVDFAIGFVMKTSFDIDYPIFVDKISSKTTIIPYKVYENIEDAKKALKDGTLKYDEVYCYAVHDIKSLYPEVLEFHTKKEVQDYLINYNKEKETCLNWTFMDDEEKEELRQKQNRKYIK